MDPVLVTNSVNMVATLPSTALCTSVSIIDAGVVFHAECDTTGERTVSSACSFCLCLAPVQVYCVCVAVIHHSLVQRWQCHRSLYLSQL